MANDKNCGYTKKSIGAITSENYATQELQTKNTTNNTMNPYRNINLKELPALLRASYDENGGDMENAAHDLETIDLMLGVLKTKSLINSRSRKKETRWSRGRNFQGIMEAIILRNK